jgi:hypothetical protein
VQGNIQNQIKALEERITELEQQLARVQNTDTLELNEIECRELRIVSEKGNVLMTLSAPTESESGAIRVLGKTGEVLSLICADDEGGIVSVRPTGQGSPNSLSAGGAEMHVDEHGNGFVAALNPDGGVRASLGVAYPDLGSGGLVTVYGTVDNRERVVIGCNPETDSGSIKTYSGTWHKTHSLEDEPCDLRLIAPPPGYNSDLRGYRHVLEVIEGKLQDETDETVKRFLNVKKSAISQMFSQGEGNETP